jgi:hypothetical protein
MSAMGQIGFQGLHEISRPWYSSEMPYISITTKICDDCVMGKQHKENAPKKIITKSSQQNELIHQTFVVHFDICHWEGQSTSSHLHMIIPKKLGHSSYH